MSDPEPGNPIGGEVLTDEEVELFRRMPELFRPRCGLKAIYQNTADTGCYDCGRSSDDLVCKSCGQLFTIGNDEPFEAQKLTQLNGERVTPIGYRSN